MVSLGALRSWRLAPYRGATSSGAGGDNTPARRRLNRRLDRVGPAAGFHAPRLEIDMRMPLLCGSLVLLAACGKKEPAPAADSAAMAAPAAAAPAEATPTLDRKAMAGTWLMKASRAGSDSVILEFEMTATADSTPGSITFKGRPPVPSRLVAVEGDSMVSEAGPYPSALRKGVQVTTRSVMRMSGDMIMGTSTAHYQGGGPDSVVMLNMRGTRKP
jgi:hypothetical protein